MRKFFTGFMIFVLVFGFVSAQSGGFEKAAKIGSAGLQFVPGGEAASQVITGLNVVRSLNPSQEPQIEQILGNLLFSKAQEVILNAVVEAVPDLKPIVSTYNQVKQFSSLLGSEEDLDVDIGENGEIVSTNAKDIPISDPSKTSDVSALFGKEKGSIFTEGNVFAQVEKETGITKISFKEGGGSIKGLEGGDFDNIVSREGEESFIELDNEGNLIAANFYVGSGGSTLNNVGGSSLGMVPEGTLINFQSGSAVPGGKSTLNVIPKSGTKLDNPFVVADDTLIRISGEDIDFNGFKLNRGELFVDSEGFYLDPNQRYSKNRGSTSSVGEFQGVDAKSLGSATINGKYIEASEKLYIKDYDFSNTNNLPTDVSSFTPVDTNNPNSPIGRELSNLGLPDETGDGFLLNNKAGDSNEVFFNTEGFQENPLKVPLSKEDSYIGAGPADTPEKLNFNEALEQNGFYEGLNFNPNRISSEAIMKYQSQYPDLVQDGKFGINSKSAGLGSNLRLENSNSFFTDDNIPASLKAEYTAKTGNEWTNINDAQGKLGVTNDGKWGLETQNAYLDNYFGNEGFNDINIQANGESNVGVGIGETGTSVVTDTTQGGEVEVNTRGIGGDKSLVAENGDVGQKPISENKGLKYTPDSLSFKSVNKELNSESQLDYNPEDGTLELSSVKEDAGVPTPDMDAHAKRILDESQGLYPRPPEEGTDILLKNGANIDPDKIANTLTCNTGRGQCGAVTRDIIKHSAGISNKEFEKVFGTVYNFDSTKIPGYVINKEGTLGISVSDAQPGDLIFFRTSGIDNHHVGVVQQNLGNGDLIFRHQPGIGQPISTYLRTYPNRVTEIARPNYCVIPRLCN